MSDPTSMPIPSERDIPLARATLARFIAAAFSEPAPACLTTLGEPAIRRELQVAARTIGMDAQRVEFLLDVYAGDHDRAETYVRCLGHTVRGECPPYELEYRATEVFQQTQTLADIAGFYRAFGFRSAGPVMEREDHIAAEWEFLAVLAMMQSLAERDEQITACRNAQRAFLKDHAAAWMPAFFSRLCRAAPDSFLACVAGFSEIVLRNWCDELSVAIGPAWLELRPVTDEDSTITCGAPGAVELGPTLAAAMDEVGG